MGFISGLLSGNNLIYCVEGLTFLSILLLLFYVYYALNLLKKD